MNIKNKGMSWLKYVVVILNIAFAVTILYPIIADGDKYLLLLAYASIVTIYGISITVYVEHQLNTATTNNNLSAVKCTYCKKVDEEKIDNIITQITELYKLTHTGSELRTNICKDCLNERIAGF